MLDGELTFQLGDEIGRARAGTLVFAPRGSHHTLANHGTQAARYLLVITPPGFERYFDRLSAELTGDSAAARVAEAVPGDDGRRATHRPHALNRLTGR